MVPSGQSLEFYFLFCFQILLLLVRLLWGAPTPAARCSPADWHPSAFCFSFHPRVQSSPPSCQGRSPHLGIQLCQRAQHLQLDMVLQPSPRLELQHHRLAKHRQSWELYQQKAREWKALGSSQIKNLMLLLCPEPVNKIWCCWGKAMTQFPALSFRGIQRHFPHCIHRTALYSHKKVQSTFSLCNSESRSQHQVIKKGRF